MALKTRNYFIGIIVVTAFLIFLWSSYSSDHPVHPQINSSAFLTLKSSWKRDKRPAFISNGRVQAEKVNLHEGPKMKLMEIRKERESYSEQENDLEVENEGEGLDTVYGVENPADEQEYLDIDTEKQEKNLYNDGESLTTVEDLGEKLQPNSIEKYAQTREKAYGKRYLIYLCDPSLKCSGFADRQRAIVGLYLMALATNRTFGLIMKVPASIQDFYVPNKVNWDINPEDLVGKSTIELDCISKKNKCDFRDFNAVYPQDVIYLRTKNDFLHILGKLGHYRDNLPDWALGSQIVNFGHAWTTLMKPSELLRESVNSLLLEVAKDMHQDVNIIPKIQKTESCVKACKEFIKQENFQNQSINECFGVLYSLKKLNHQDRIVFLRHMCSVEAAITPPSLDAIKTATGYDYVELEMVCAQIRLGKSLTLRGEPETNDMKDVVQIWDHLRPYINKGHHMFLASDSQEVRDQAREMFGPRVHINSDPIVHVNKVRPNQDGWLGMKTALMEQLVLSTSCKVLVFSATGFGRRAAMVRHILTEGKEGFKAYEFYDGRIEYKDFNKKPPTLPVRKN